MLFTVKGLDFQNTKAVYLCFIGWNGLANICIHPGISLYELARFNVYAMKHRNAKGLFLKWSINENLLRCASFDIISCRASYITMVILQLAANLSRYIIYAGYECLEIPYYQELCFTFYLWTRLIFYLIHILSFGMDISKVNLGW